MDRNLLITTRLCRLCGQARKSLWIETEDDAISSEDDAGQARKSLWIETPCIFNDLHISMVRLVRACGSKLTKVLFPVNAAIGQARKSLWIETPMSEHYNDKGHGSGS